MAPAANAAAPAAPTGVTVTEVNYESFVFQWKTVPGATSYTGKLATNSAFTSGVQYFATTKTSRKPIHLKNCTTYYFKVKANRGSVSGGYSTARKVTLNCFWPREFTTIKVVPKSGSGIGLSWTRPQYATRFEIWRSTDSGFSANLVKARTSNDWYVDTALKATKPGKSYYYRILAFNKSNTTNVRYSPKFEANPLPSVPQGLKVAGASPNGATLTWTPAWNGRQYQVRAATDAGFTNTVETLATTDGRNHVTFNKLNPAKKYYFQVRSVNGLKQNIARSAYSGSVSGSTLPAGVPLTALTFNIRTASGDGGLTSSQRWTSRKAAVAATIAGSGADVVGVQEAYDYDDYPGGDGKTPQWADLRAALDPYGYKRAPTGTDGLSTKCNLTVSCRTDEYQLDGNHIFYNASTVKPVGKGGKISLPNPDGRTSGYAAPWQVFQKLDGGAGFVAVDTHLYSTGITDRGVYEDRRTAQVNAILSGLKTIPDIAGLPVVLLGDLNSHQSHNPVSTLLAGGLADTAGLDVPKVKANFNSSHGFVNPPPSTFGTRIDYVMASSDVATRSWELVAKIDPDTGKFIGTIPSDHHAIKAVLTLPVRTLPAG